MSVRTAYTMGQSMTLDKTPVTMPGPIMSPVLSSDNSLSGRFLEDDYAIIDLDDADLFVDNVRKRTPGPVRTVGLSSDSNSGFEGLMQKSEIKLDLEELISSKARFQAAGAEGRASQAIPSRQQRHAPWSAQLAATLKAETATLQHNLRTLLGACSVTELLGTQFGPICSCCRLELAAMTIATTHNVESSTIQLCSPCYSLVTASSPLSCEDALLVLDFLVRLLEAKDQLTEANTDETNTGRQIRPSQYSSISRANGSRIVGKLETHLNHDHAKRTLSMALLSVSLNNYSNLHRGMLQVQTCLLRSSALNTQHLTADFCKNRRLSKTETVHASGKTKWSQLFEWSDVQNDQTLDMTLEISIWRKNPKCLVGVAQVPVSAASGYHSNGPQMFNVHYRPAEADDEQVSHVPELEISQQGTRRSSSDAPESDPSFLSRLKTFFTADKFTMDPDDVINDDDQLSSSMIIETIKRREITWIVSQGTNEDNDDYAIEEVVRTFQLGDDDGDDIPDGDNGASEWNARPRASSHERLGVSGAPTTSLDTVTIDASPLARRSSTVPPSTSSTARDGTYFVYPILIPRRFSSSNDLVQQWTNNWESTLAAEKCSLTKQRSQEASPLQGSPQASLSDSNAGVDGSATLRAQAIRKSSHMLSTVVDSEAASSDAFQSSGCSSDRDDGITTIRRALPKRNAETLITELAIRRERQQHEHSDVTETFQRLVQVRDKLYQGLASSALASAGDEGTNGVSTSCPVSLCATPDRHAKEQGELVDALEVTSNTRTTRHIKFTGVENVEGRRQQGAGHAKSETCPPTEIRLNWTDDGKEVTISVEEARNIYISSRGKTLPSGIYCKAHLYTKDGRRLKAKSSTARFSTNPHFNEKLIFNATAQGGEMKIMLWGSQRRVGRHQLLCSAMLVTSSPTSPIARSHEGTAAFSGAALRCQGSGEDPHWYRMMPEGSTLPLRSEFSSPKKLHVPRVLHRFGQRRLGDRKYSASMGNLATNS